MVCELQVARCHDAGAERHQDISVAPAAHIPSRCALVARREANRALHYPPGKPWNLSLVPAQGGAVQELLSENPVSSIPLGRLTAGQIVFEVSGDPGL